MSHSGAKIFFTSSEECFAFHRSHWNTFPKVQFINHITLSPATSSKPEQNLVKGVKTVKLMSTSSQLGTRKCSVMFIYPHTLDYPDTPIQILTFKNKMTKETISEMRIFC